jgi:hypothetical protein
MKLIKGPQGPGDDSYEIIDIYYEDGDYGSSEDGNENRNHVSLNSKQRRGIGDTALLFNALQLERQ